MRREIHVRLSFGDLIYLWTLLRCINEHRSWSCLRQGLRAWRLQFTGGDPTWEPFTLGDWIELRRWRAWAAREHEREPEPAPWRHEAATRPLPRTVVQEHRRDRTRQYRRFLVYPGLSLFVIAGGSFGGVLLYQGHFVGFAVTGLVTAVLTTFVLRYTGRLD